MHNKRTRERKEGMRASVILPSYNRRDILKKVLLSLEKQSAAKDQYEVIVSDDGSTDETAIFLKEYAEITPLDFKYILAKKNSGPAKARNLALKKSTHEIVIIIGDDIVLESNFVEEHLFWHEGHPKIEQAVLGYVTWPQELNPNAFMCWLEHGGKTFFFPYKDFSSGQQIACQHFYTCNLSLKKRFLFQTSLFDESFPYASHEDIELGDRLRLNGMELFYEADLKGYHWHYLHVNSIARRVYLMGYSAPIYWEKVSGHSGKIKKNAREILCRFASMSICWKVLTRLFSNRDLDNRCHRIRWKLILTLSYWIGFADGNNKNPVKIFPGFGQE